MYIDLQLHSTYSDGYLTPTELVKFIASQGIKIAALTDHNTVGGINEFKDACLKYKIKPITGVELYIKLNSIRCNILWYNLDEKNPELHDILRDSQKRRRAKMRSIMKKLIKRGFKININKILDKYNHYVPINHVVDDIITVPGNLKKIKKELGEEFTREGNIINKYFKNENIGVLRESYINLERILKLRKKIGGQLILNHPAKHRYIKKDFWERLKGLGIDGVEILSPHHSIGAVMYVQFLARELDFIETGGSDFHRHEGDKELIQNSWEYFKIDSKYLRGIKKIIS